MRNRNQPGINCSIRRCEDNPTTGTKLSDISNKYSFTGLDDSIKTTKSASRVSGHINLFKPNDDAPVFRD